MIILKVLIEHAAYALNRPFSYVYKKSVVPMVGARVLVPFRNVELVGYIENVEEVSMSKEEYEKEIGYKLLEALQVIDTQPILNIELRNLAKDISEYYLSPLISVYQAMLPPSLKPTSASLNNAKIAYVKYLKCINSNEEHLTLKQVELLRLIKESGEIKKSDINSQSIIKKLIENGNIVEFLKEKQRFNYNDTTIIKDVILTKDQEKVKEEFLNSEDKVFLLEGVTGSGKTEVYISIVQEIVKQNKTALILVPEISLTPIMLKRFYGLFKNKVAILHSNLTSGEKYDEYRRILRQEVDVVIGTRSAVFAPLNNIGVIIIDEEHVESYKQENTPCYHAREVAIMRAKMHEYTKVLLGSATPSLESESRAIKKIYHHLVLDKRVNEKELPKTRIINLQNFQNIDYQSSLFSIPLRKAIKDRLSHHEQIILLLNRRGYSTSVLCRECGHSLKCPTCDIPLVYHSHDKLLKCHNCGYVEELKNYCPECGSKYLSKVGFGSEKVEEEIKKLFPEARTLRLDSDVGKIKNNISKVLNRFANYEADILIGTQMIAKGHDFPNVTLVGLVLADLGLSLPSIRSSERTFELITQAIGRSGRGEKEGEAIIQSYMPNHYSIIYGAKQDYRSFFQNEMKIRHLQQNPPYTYVSTLQLVGKNESFVNEMAIRVIRQVVKESKGQIMCIGPTKPYVYKDVKGYKRICLFKYKNKKEFDKIMIEILDVLSKKSGISIKIDVDAIDI